MVWGSPGVKWWQRLWKAAGPSDRERGGLWHIRAAGRNEVQFPSARHFKKKLLACQKLHNQCADVQGRNKLIGLFDIFTTNKPNLFILNQDRMQRKQFFVKIYIQKKPKIFRDMHIIGHICPYLKIFYIQTESSSQSQSCYCLQQH